MKMSTILVQPETTTSTWVIDRVHSTSQFKVKHMMISNVLGEFTSITGVLERDENDITKSKIRASIDADTINTRDRKSTRLNSSHGYISYAVFCLKKKNAQHRQRSLPRGAREADRRAAGPRQRQQPRRRHQRDAGISERTRDARLNSASRLHQGPR